MRGLQMLLHIPLLAIIVPSVVMMVFKIIIPVVMFDLLETEETPLSFGPEYILEFDDDSQESLSESIISQT